jgi:hypothetical protein
MTQLEPQERLSKAKKLAIVMLLNLFFPALGNLLLIGKTTGNFVCLLICLLALGWQDWRMVMAWSLFMNLRAVVDIYIMPAHIARKRGEQQPSYLKGRHEESAFNYLSANEGTGCPSHQLKNGASEKVGQPDEAAAREHALEHDRRPGADHFQTLPTGEPEDSGGAPQGHGARHAAGEHDWSHGAPLPHSAHHTTGEPGHSHGAPLPLNALHTTGEHEHAHSTPLSLNSHHSTGEHEHSHGTPQPLNACHSTGESLSNAGNHARNAGSNQDAEAAGSSEHIVNQHEVIDSLMHPVAATGEGRQRRVELAESHKAEESDGGVIYDIYDAEEEDGEESKLSPISDGLFHTVGTAPAPAAVSQAAVLLEEAETGEHSHHLSPVNYGKSQSEENQPAREHKKHVQLCATCQREREHNRPTCPACGTHYDTEVI